MRVNPLIVFRREFDGSGILFNPDNGETFGLNPTSTFIWECLEKEMSNPDIVTALRTVAANVPERVDSELEEFLVSLRDKSFVAL